MEATFIHPRNASVGIPPRAVMPMQTSGLLWGIKGLWGEGELCVASGELLLGVLEAGGKRVPTALGRSRNLATGFICRIKGLALPCFSGF